MRENRTYRLSGGRRRALRWAPPPTRHRRSGGIEPTRPRGGKGAPAGGTVGGKDGHHTEVGSRLHVTTTDSRTGQTSLRDGGGHRLASWTSGYATARSEAVCRGAGMRQNPHVRICGGPGSATTPWSTRPRRCFTAPSSTRITARRSPINRPDSVSARCGVSSRPLSSNGSRRFTVSCRICSESVDTSCDRLTTVCSALARSLNGMR